MRGFTFRLAALAACATGGAAYAQVGNQFRLDLSLVARSGTAQTGLTDIDGPVVISSGQTVRLEVRYRLHDLVVNNVAARGLAAVDLRMSNDRGSVAGIIRKAALTNYQADPSAFGPPMLTQMNPDLTGEASGLTGVPEPFRGFGAPPNDSSLSNGSIVQPNGSFGPAGLTMDGSNHALPVVLTGPPGHQSWAGSAGKTITAADTNTNLGTWTLFSFEYQAAADFQGAVTFRVRPEADFQTLNAFALFTRTGSVNNPVPPTGQAFSEGLLTINVVPGPGAGAVLVVGAVTMLRRRRRF